MRPPAKLLERLSSMRYRLNLAKPSVGVGDRRSRAKGSGMEFADHRPYREGDDTRHLDVRLFARLGKSFVREYSIDRQLPVYVILDASTSMVSGNAAKYAFAAAVAQLFSFIALTSGDQVQLGVFNGSGLAWSTKFQGGSRVNLVFDWLGKQPTGGQLPFSEALRLARETMVRSAMVILISDFWDEQLDKALTSLSADQHDLVGVHVIAPQDLDPAALGRGPAQIVDAESGEVLEIVLDADMTGQYQAAFQAFAEDVNTAFSRRQGRYFQLSTEADLEQLFLRDLRGAGLIS